MEPDPNQPTASPGAGTGTLISSRPISTVEVRFDASQPNNETPSQPTRALNRWPPSPCASLTCRLKHLPVSPTLGYHPRCVPPALAEDLLALFDQFPRLTQQRLARDLGLRAEAVGQLLRRARQRRSLAELEPVR